MTKQLYGDLFERVRRRRPMSVVAERVWRVLPPLTFGTDRVVISGVVAPVYQLGGDSFDYAVDARTARIAVFDAMGPGLEAGAAGQRGHGGFPEQSAGGSASGRDGDGHRSRRCHRIRSRSVRRRGARRARPCLGTAALLGLRPPAAPAPAKRSGRQDSCREVTPPLGMSGSVVVSEEMLEPADQVLFFTDGVVEARSADGEFLGVDRLVDMITRTSAAATRAPETMLRPFTPSSTTRRANCRTTSPSWWSSGAARAAVHGDKPSGVTQLRCGPVVSQRYVPSRHRVGLRRYHIVDVPSRQRLGVGSRSPPTRPLATSAAAGCGDDWRQGRREAGHGSR
jgi:hypothetical protein